MTEAQNWWDCLDKNHKTYQSAQMVAEKRLSNLQKAWEDPNSWETNYREHEENLRSAQEMNQFLPITEDHKRPQSSHESMALPEGFAPYAGSSVNVFGGHFASDGVMAGQGRPAHAPAWDFGSENTTGSGTPDLLNSTNRPSPASASSVDSTFMLPQKRQRDSPSKGIEYARPVMKARRTTPSPSMSGADTPSSYASSGHVEGIPEDLYGLLGGDRNEAARELANSRKEQEEHMKAVEAKRQQELADEAFARSLQEELNGPSSPAGMLRAGPSSSTSSQTYLTADGQVHRPVKVFSSPSPVLDDLFAGVPTSFEPQSSYRPRSSTNIKQESVYQDQSARTATKKEHLHLPNHFSSSINGSDDFITLDSDDDTETQDLVGAARRSSDLVEIDAQSWRQSNSQMVPSAFSSGLSTNQGSYGNSEGVGSWNAITNTAQGYADNVYNAIGQAVSLIGSTTGLGGTSLYGTNSTSSSLGIPIVDLDDENYASQNFYQRNMTRAGLNPMDVDLVNRYRERYDYIAQDPTRTLREMKELLENIRPDEELPPENREGTPAAMIYNLMEHQKLGVAWMRRMEEGSNHGGSKSPYSPFACSLRLITLYSSGR